MYSHNKCNWTINALLTVSTIIMVFFLLFFDSVMFASRTDKMLIRVTGATFIFEKQTPRWLLIPSLVVIVTEGRFWGDLWCHPFPSDTGSVEVCIQMTGGTATSHNISVWLRLLEKHLAEQIKAILEARANHALPTLVSIIPSIKKLQLQYISAAWSSRTKSFLVDWIINYLIFCTGQW